MSLVWATRGRSWGFRFLLDGGYPDPLPTYDRAFRGTEGERLVCTRVGDLVAVRMPDPEGRRDAAGRVIPHNLVMTSPLADDIHSVEDAKRLVWSDLREAFEVLWSLPSAPVRADVLSALRSGSTSSGM